MTHLQDYTNYQLYKLLAAAKMGINLVMATPLEIHEELQRRGRPIIQDEQEDIDACTIYYEPHTEQGI